MTVEESLGEQLYWFRSPVRLTSQVMVKWPRVAICSPQFAGRVKRFNWCSALWPIDDLWITPHVAGGNPLSHNSNGWSFHWERCSCCNQSTACQQVDGSSQHWLSTTVSQRASSDKATAYTRDGFDWTGRYPGIVAAAANLDCCSAMLDDVHRAWSTGTGVIFRSVVAPHHFTRSVKDFATHRR